MVKRVAGSKGSRLKKIFCARVVSQRIQRVMQSRLHGAQRDIHGFRDLRKSQALYKPQQQHFAMFFGEVCQRGRKVARVDIARKLAEAIWYMLTRNQPFAPAGATTPLAA